MRGGGGGLLNSLTSTASTAIRSSFLIPSSPHPLIQLHKMHRHRQIAAVVELRSGGDAGACDLFDIVGAVDKVNMAPSAECAPEPMAQKRGKHSTSRKGVTPRCRAGWRARR